MNLFARTVSLKDADLILDWRNSIDARMASRDSSPIPITEHYKWLKRWLDEGNRGYFWIYSEGKKDIGYVRFDASGRNSLFEISIYIVESGRGKGAGKMMLEDALTRISVLEKVASVRASVLKSNLASMKLFSSLGFKQTNSAELWEEFLFTVT